VRSDWNSVDSKCPIRFRSEQVGECKVQPISTSLTWNSCKWAMSTMDTEPGKKKKMKMDKIDEMGKGREKGVGKGKAKKKGMKGLR